MSTDTDRIERQIFLKAPRARVWAALSNADEFGAWFGMALRGRAFQPDQHVSGNITIKGFEHVVFDVRIVDVEPEQRLSMRWHPYPVDPAIDYSKEPTTLIEFDLQESDGGTLLRVVESGFDKIPAARRAETFRMNSQGWEGQMRNIEQYLAGH